MSARLALDLDHDAIRLLSQQSDGWVVEGVAELDATDLTARISALRQRAEDLSGADPAVLLVLPPSQVLYTTFDGLEDPEREVTERLEGMTPYAVSEITWDQVTKDGRTDVAAVALETIDEALAFAASSRFRVVGLTSEPPEGAFPRLPVFQRLPAFLRGGERARPLVLEPPAPPQRKAVAFSGQRGVDYSPELPDILPRRTAGRTREAARKLPAQVAALLALIPKPIAAAMAVGGAVVLAAALWPEGDPDPFTKRNHDLSFATLPAAMVEGLGAPGAGEDQGALTWIEPVTVLRDPPAIAVPVVIGASPVAVDYLADVEPAEAFLSIASFPALFGETRLPETGLPRPVVLTRPDLPEKDAPEAGGVARADEPAPLPMPAADDEEAPRPVAVADAELPRAANTLPPVTDATEAPSALAALPVPTLLGDAPADAAPPPEGAPLAVAVAPYAGTEPVADPATLPGARGLADPGPDAAMALLPPAAGEQFDLGADGFVVATPEGTATPGGVTAFAATPPLVAPPRPGSETEAPLADTPLADAVEPEEPVAEEETPVLVARANPNPELADVLPRPRPLSAEPEPEAPEAVIAEALEAPGDIDPAELEPEPVMTVSLVPRPRPERSAVEATTATATRAVTAAPRLPSRANVAREATLEDALPLGQMNLIGVYGSASDRRAIVRLPTGRFVKLKVGDRLDGGQVAQIGSDRLLYQKGGRTLALEMPNT